MGKVAVSFRIMPEGVEVDLDAIQRRVKVEWPRIRKSAAPECQPGVRWHTSTCYSLHDDGRIA